MDILGPGVVGNRTRSMNVLNPGGAAVPLVPQDNGGKELATPDGILYTSNANSQYDYLRVDDLDSSGAAIVAGDSVGTPFGWDETNQVGAGTIAAGLPADVRQLGLNTTSTSDYMQGFDLSNTYPSLMMDCEANMDSFARLIRTDNTVSADGIEFVAQNTGSGRHRTIIFSAGVNLGSADANVTAGSALIRRYLYGSYATGTGDVEGLVWRADTDSEDSRASTTVAAGLFPFARQSALFCDWGGGNSRTPPERLHRVAAWSAVLDANDMAALGAAGGVDGTENFLFVGLRSGVYDPRALWDSTQGAVTAGELISQPEAGGETDGFDTFAADTFARKLDLTGAFTVWMRCNVAVWDANQLLLDSTTDGFWIYNLHSTGLGLRCVTIAGGVVQAIVELLMGGFENVDVDVFITRDGAGNVYGATYSAGTLINDGSASGGAITPGDDHSMGARADGSFASTDANSITFVRASTTEYSSAQIAQIAAGTLVGDWDVLDLQGVKTDNYTAADAPVLIVESGAGADVTAEDLI